MASNSSDALPYLPPDSPISELRSHYIGKILRQIPTPSAVLDRAIVARNCAFMLDACAGPDGKESARRGLGVGFRAHVKSHKVR